MSDSDLLTGQKQKMIDVPMCQMTSLTITLSLYKASVVGT